jgi:hypothetical protein
VGMRQDDRLLSPHGPGFHNSTIWFYSSHNFSGRCRNEHR